MSNFGKFSNIAYMERHNAILWLVVSFLLGIVIFLQFSFFSYIQLLVGLIILSILALLFRNTPIPRFFLLAIIAICFGYLNTKMQFEHKQNFFIKKTSPLLEIQAKIDRIEPRERGARIYFTAIKVNSDITEFRELNQIRLNVLTSYRNVAPGDTVSFTAILKPIPKQIHPNSFDFQRWAFLNEINAIGFATTEIELVSRPSFSFKEKIYSIRIKIKDIFYNSLPKTEASILSALILGLSGVIDKEIMNQIRISGLAHILAISGMHLVLVASFFFITSRFFLSCFTYITIRCDIRKYAALVALLGSFAYLIISGYPVSAIRAFIMVAIFLVAILIERFNNPMRAVAFAAFVILVYDPFSILLPGFQMSFAAVIALIAFFSKYQNFSNELTKYTFFAKCYRYILSTVAATVIAGLATSPFAIYHFNMVASYSVLANLLAVPLSSLVIMPLSVITLILIPINLYIIPLKLLGLSISILVTIAQYFSELPASYKLVQSISIYSFTILIVSFFVVCLLQNRFRFLIIIPAFILIMFVIKPETTPDLIIAGEGKNFAFKDESGKLVIFSGSNESYFAKIIALKSGQTQIISQDKTNYDISNNLNCDNLSCIYRKNGHTIAIVFNAHALKDDCKKSELVFNLTSIKFPCQARIISGFDLYKNGTYLIEADNELKIKNIK